MKLLLDENLSRRLVPALQARFPGYSHNDAVLKAMLAAADRLHEAFADPGIGVVLIE